MEGTLIFYGNCQRFLYILVRDRILYIDAYTKMLLYKTFQNQLISLLTLKWNLSVINMLFS
jgi:hypothetical protein